MSKILEPTDELTAMSACPAGLSKETWLELALDTKVLDLLGGYFPIASFPGHGHGANSIRDRSCGSQEGDARHDGGYLQWTSHQVIKS